MIVAHGIERKKRTYGMNILERCYDITKGEAHAHLFS